MNGTPTHIAVFGDVHGHLRLMFQLCRHWQVQNRQFLDGILQCGDLGFFPNLGMLDKATMRFAQRDPEELGFAYFFRKVPPPAERDPLLERTLRGDPDDLNTVRCHVIFCHGNHEDFQALDWLTGGGAYCSVDTFDRIFLLRSGETCELGNVRVGALGGKPEYDRPADSQVLGPTVSHRAARRLMRQRFDILLSHGAPTGANVTGEPLGSHLSRQVLEASRPAYHFYSHHKNPIPPAKIGPTECHWLEDVNFRLDRSAGTHTGPPAPGCMGILSWRSQEEHHFEIVDIPWFQSLNGNNWLDDSTRA